MKEEIVNPMEYFDVEYVDVEVDEYGSVISPKRRKTRDLSKRVLDSKRKWKDRMEMRTERSRRRSRPSGNSVFLFPFFIGLGLTATFGTSFFLFAGIGLGYFLRGQTTERVG